MGCPKLGQPLTHPVFLPGPASPKSCVVAHLERGKDPWVPDRGDVSPATARETWRGPGSGEWELGAEVTLGLGSHCTMHLPCVLQCLLLGPVVTPFLDISLSCHFYFVPGPWMMGDHTAPIPTSPPFSCSPLFAGPSTFAYGNCVRGWACLLIDEHWMPAAAGFSWACAHRSLCPFPVRDLLGPAFTESC